MGYWKIRGLAAPLRMMCEYGAAAYISKEYDVTVKEGGGYALIQFAMLCSLELGSERCYVQI